MSNLKRLLLILFVILVGASVEAAGQESSRSWEPQKTWVVAVGILEWEHGDSWDSFPKEGRKDAELVEFFAQAGVPRDHILFLKDREATRERIRRSTARHLSRAGEGDLLIFYFTGHGELDEDTGTVYFANYDAVEEDLARSAWSVPSIFETIERNFRGSRALLTADVCYSGALADEAAKRRSHISYAALTSSRSDSLSTANWTFTEALLRGFRGSARIDRNMDGEVALSELARYARSTMWSQEGQLTSFATTKNFPPETVLAEVKGRASARTSARVEVEWEGDWYPAVILEVRGARYKIHYLGYGSEWDEWVGAGRLRRTSTVAPASRKLSLFEFHTANTSTRLLQLRV